MLFKLHWLAVKERIEYKILLLTYKALSSLAPSYIFDMFKIYVPERNLRSLVDKQLVVPKYNLELYGGRSFSVSARILWSKLPQTVRVHSLF